MTRTAAGDGSDAGPSGTVGLHPVQCRACGQSLLDDEPIVYEFIADGTVDAIAVGADEALEVPRGAAFVDTFHPSCFDTLVRCWGDSADGHWTGYCSLSEHRIIAPHPIAQCPICGEYVVEASPREAEG